jgi:hypothetical protein
MAGQQEYPSVPTVTSPLTPYEVQSKPTITLPSKQHRVQVNLRQILIELPAVDLKSVKHRESNQIGVNRTVGIASQTYGRKFKNSDGTEIRLLAIKSPGAVRVRVHFTNVDLPAEDALYVYGTSKDAVVAGPYRGKGPWNSGDFWSRSIEGDTVVIEYFSRTGQGSFDIPEISHIYEQVAAEDTHAPDLLGCHIDASCSTAPEKNAVGRIAFTTPTGSFVCTGTLLNDRANDHIPYFLTANHCVSTQAIAQTVETYWFYQTASCNSGGLRTWVYSGAGADLLATQRANDFALIRLVDSAPAGAAYAGWDAAPLAVGTSVRGFHHPAGFSPPSVQSHLRRSDGSVNSTSVSCSATGLSGGFRVAWTMGTTEPGSSGSGVWYSGQSSYLVGVLSCGPPPTCTDPDALYSKFSQFYSQIQPFIDPPTGGSAPSATTTAPTNVTSTSATLHGIVNPNGLSTDAYFQYGLTSNYGNPTAPGNLGSGTVNLDVQTTLTTSPNTTYHYRIVASNSAGTTNGSEGVFTTPSGGNSGLFANISTRLRVLTGDNVLIGGFILSGAQSKRVILRALGPSLPVAGALSDTILELRDSFGNLIGFNDDWRTDQQGEIITTGLAPSHDYDSAIVATLPANNSTYTAVVRGYNGATGVGIVEAFDLDQAVDSRFANISTRGFVGTGDNVMIGGTIVTGGAAIRVLVRAIGPSLANVGIAGALPDPTLELRDSNGLLVAYNDDWRTDQQVDILGTGIPPSNNLESAIVRTLSPGAYTAIVKNYIDGVTGVALVEVYRLAN